MIRAMKPVWLLLLALLSSNATLAQAPAKGMLLVATPELRDPRFSETVLLLLHYGPEGAIGVAINRPTWVEPTAAFPDMESLGRYRGNLYIGGPVARANVLVLVRDAAIEFPDTEPVVDDVFVSADPEFLDEISPTANSDETLRLYAGHASWEAGQLDREIARGSWQVVPATADLVFAREPLELWRQVLVLESEMSVDLPRTRAPIAAVR